MMDNKYLEDGPVTVDNFEDYYHIWRKGKKQFLKDEGIDIQCSRNKAIEGEVKMTIGFLPYTGVCVEIGMPLIDININEGTLAQQWRVNSYLTAGLNKLMSLRKVVE